MPHQALAEGMKMLFTARIQKFWLYFVMYAVFGWSYEVFLEVVIYRWGFSDRGVLFGPYCPVYGFGALIFLILVYPIIRNKPLKKRLFRIPLVFVLSALSATLLELATSYLCEAVYGTWPWQTYSQYRIHFQARIALSPSLRFGLGGVLFLYLLQPLFERMTGTMSRRTLSFVSAGIAVLFSADLICTAIALLR